MTGWTERAADLWTRGPDSLVRARAEWWLLRSEPPRMRLVGPFSDRATAMAAADDAPARECRRAAEGAAEGGSPR